MKKVQCFILLFRSTTSTANVLIARGGVQPSRLKLEKRVFKRITFLSCFEFRDGGILTRKSANIGPGHFVHISPKLEAYIKAITVRNVYDCQILRRSGQFYPFDKDMDPSLCAPEKVKKSNFKPSGTVDHSEHESEDEVEAEDISEAKSGDKNTLYKCPNDLCTADYIKTYNLAKHVRMGICKARLRSQSQMNHAKTIWFSRFGIQDKSMLNEETSRLEN